MRTYIESKIDAFGRTFAILVTDEKEFCFNVIHTLPATGKWSLPVARFNKRSEAIQEAARLAIEWCSQ